MNRLAYLSATVILAAACALGAVGCGDNIDPVDPSDPVCGDGTREGDEACDDGNTTAGDGCSPTCTTETPGAMCGNGRLDAGETCDDDDTDAGDGCSATCQPEAGFACTGTPSVCTSTCGDGVRASDEACDDDDTDAGDGCSATCTVEAGWDCNDAATSACAAICGDNMKIEGVEACDDGNQVDFDGCSHVCQNDRFDELEPNDTAAQATDAVVPPVLIRGGISPGSDVDYVKFTVPATADVSIETVDARGLGSCNNVDTQVTLYAADGTTVVATDDDGGVGGCSLIAPSTTPRAARLAAGTYYVAVQAQTGIGRIGDYGLVIRYLSLCGDDAISGSEECDGSARCDATCQRTVACGDGFLDGDETCDDGNTAADDGCTSACALEAVAETEPNETAATAAAARRPAFLRSGALGTATDVDVFAVELAATSDLYIETFDSTGPGHCTGIDTQVTLIGTDGTTPIIVRDQGGIGLCSRIDATRPTDVAARHLPAGTYYVKVESSPAHPATASYQLLVTSKAFCGDDVVEGGEECDGGAGCSATCDRVPVCGDGRIDLPETCDDGNTAAGDGCNATCAPEAAAESEPNNVLAEADAITTPLTSGSIGPALTDVDLFSITLDATSDITLTTSGATVDICGADTLLTLFRADGTTVVATNDDADADTACSRLVGRHLPAGTYIVKLEEFGNNSPIPAYLLRYRVEARCGDGTVGGSEECDGGAACETTCDRVPTCGDGFIDGTEACDDGGIATGDGCSDVCALELVDEIEPNNDTAAADVNAPVTGRVHLHGAIAAAGDVDVYRLTLAADTLVRLETFDGPQSCGIATLLRLRDSAGAPITSDATSGIGRCSALSAFLAAGTYYVSVEEPGNDAAVTSYTLSLSVVTGAGEETEPNERRATATALAGADVYVLGRHPTVADVDYYAITVPAGRSLRAEVIEGGATTCDSNALDSYLTLYDATGFELGNDEDAGRGYCSLIDGTGASPASPFASGLAAGTYYLAVESSDFATAEASRLFDYRLVVVVR